jgi:hypothetical protein
MKERYWKKFLHLKIFDMRKLLKRTFIITLILLPLMTFAHFMVFPQETRCIFVSFSNFEKKQNVYYSQTTTATQLENLFLLKNVAENKVKSFWRENASLDYTLIYCNNETTYNNYGTPGTPATTTRKLGAYVVLSNDGLDEQIIAHEITHTILYNHIGWYKAITKIPTWFEEGLAIQVDDRKKYAIDSLQIKINNGFVMPNVSTIANGAQFYKGNDEAISLHYVMAKYVIHEWLQTHSLSLFIKKMDAGDAFKVAYKKSLKQ